MVGFTFYYLQKRSPGPPFPPDHRQAGERGAIHSHRSGRPPNKPAAASGGVVWSLDGAPFAHPVSCLL